MNNFIKAFIGLLLILFSFDLSVNSALSQQKLYQVKGTASYYARKFHGRKTTSGEIFSNDSLTAAHKWLPFGTFVRVTNLRNDSVVVVRINDRLPKKSTRIIDLSRAAAKQLNFLVQGLTKVYVEEIPKDKIINRGG
ncbi:MAG: septal ring lytic transglycosylase RlpA family protein [Bacteroidia bacterium]|nr:septal ring lytic transglycosylase RlpA family protein [Bacteroidia bacterium]MCZ2249423.1 septal ring lytic transglycosylase RlpA family protein [Bacteroidia bacterium]